MLTVLLTLAGLVQEADPNAVPADDVQPIETDLLPHDRLLDDPMAVMQELADWAVGFAPSLVGALLTLVIGLWLARMATRGTRAVMTRANVDEALKRFLGNLVYYALVALVLIAVAGKLGVETTSFVALLGAVGLAIGFALQGSLGNLAAGVMILIFRPFRIGDYVEAAGQAGTVKEIGVFATTLTTPDNRKVIVPNAAVTGSSIVNYSAFDTRRVEVVLGISYGDDIAKARAVVERVVGADARVLKDPAPAILVAELADSSVNLKVRVWVATADYWGVFFDLVEKSKLAFDAEGITIPFPQRDVHMVQG
jgi:small conductance mechanosensitive channel